MVPGNPLAFIFVAEQPLLLCHRKAEATRPHAGALRQSLRPSPKVALSRGWEPRCPADQDEELLLHPGGASLPAAGFWPAGSKQLSGRWGLGFRAGRGSQQRRGKGSCRGDVFREGGGAADGGFGQLLLTGGMGAVGRSSPAFYCFCRDLVGHPLREGSASDPCPLPPARREPPSR